ncbi:hypothetical protein HN51_029819 [Arachis hypogaea]|uniref:F-box domain-containing protein n=1 Tax=Arachis hypogaea TaxID=3818 RepID=A0A445BDE9_ARAHY|nr:F-box/kelch-repeat protein At3g23880-like [Arachis hypogaea]QHO36533.1 F-box/kelch-repeat protein [Arachis hypogaea]RYR36704.1 hypothetical protein Ahy_A09g041658 [Arachis hypogaea]
MRGNLLGTTDKRHKHLSSTLRILPDDIIAEILVRVPASSVVKFKIVCKSWNALISSPRFASDHLHRSTADPTMTRPRLVYRSDRGFKFFSVQSVYKNPSAPTEDACFQMDDDVHILGSCNGLICLTLLNRYRRWESIRLWNPCTRLASDWLKIRPEGPIFGNYIYGFGYDHVHDNYKFLEGSLAHHYKVHTFGSNSWTTIIQDHSFYPLQAIGKFVNGTLNWAAHTRNNCFKWVILSFDLANESFYPISLPNRDHSDYSYSSVFFTMLGVLRNNLCVCFNENYSRLVLWEMKEHGFQESWTKLVTISSELLAPRRYGSQLLSYRALYIMENDDVLAVSYYSDARKLVMFNANVRQLTHTSLCEPGLHSCYVYHESLVSPSHLGLPCLLYGSTTD